MRKLRRTLFQIPQAGAYLAVAGLASCAVLGPQGIRNGRSVYNEAIALTNAEQILSIIVSVHREEPGSLLKVASITANTRMQANVGAQFGVGPESYFSGNLVPLSAGALYEENPTIVYLPVDGAEFLRQMLSPLPLETTVLLLGALGDSPSTWSFLIRGVNDMNTRAMSDLQHTPEVERLATIAELLAQLHRSGHATWLHSGTGAAASSVLILRAHDADAQSQVNRLRELLRLESALDADGRLVVPLALGVDTTDGESMVVLTRSPFELVRLAGLGIEQPLDGDDAAAQANQDVAEHPAQYMKVHCGRARPDSAFVAIEHRGLWYWIESADRDSKRTFWLVSTIVNARMADSAPGQALPVLTIPTSR